FLLVALPSPSSSTLNPYPMVEMQSKEVSPASPDHLSAASGVTDNVQEPHIEATNELSKVSTEHAYPPTAKVLLVMACLFLVLFLVALDRLIIGVAIPSITNDFNSLGDVGWYGSSYLLTSCAFMLLLGKVYTFANPKWIYIGSLIVFEIGSAICGAAPNSTALIVGRAIAGLGNAGLFQGAVIIIVYIVPLHKRPQYMGVLGMVFGVASAVGPLLGGAFTDGPGWRWCFYNIPVEMLERNPTTWKEKITQMDPIGTFFFLPSIVCLLLALQWGGVTYNWSNARIIVLLILAGILLIGFVIVQKWKGDNATVPGRIFMNRSVIAGFWFSFCMGGAMQTLFYFLPIWFQAIKHASAVKSGIMSLPFVLALVIMSISAGILTKKIGYYTPWMIISSVLTPIGAGLITTFTPHTGHSAWIGYQVIFGFGVGLGNQQPSVAAQTVLSRKDVSIGAALMMFSQTLGGAVFISVANNLFDSRLSQNLADIPGLVIGSVASIGATDLRKLVPANLLPQVLVGYNDALRATFYLVTALACCTVFGAAAMEWKSVKEGRQKRAPGAVKDEEKLAEKA
ncbi:Roquefortine meleagrin synthesis T, partial [Hyphodiscus hymeniophilus]